MPPGLDLAEAQRDLALLDALRKNMAARFTHSASANKIPPVDNTAA